MAHDQSSPQPSRPIRIEGHEKITLAEGIPPITVNWETSENMLRTEVVLEGKDGRSTSVIEIPMDASYSPSPAAPSCAEATEAPPESELHVAAIVAGNPGSNPSLEEDAPSGEPALEEESPSPNAPLSAGVLAVRAEGTTNPADSEFAASIDEPSLAVLPITPNAMQPVPSCSAGPQQEISNQTTQSFPVVAPMAQPQSSTPPVLPLPQSSALEGEARELSIPTEKLDKKGRPKKRHRVRNIIIAIVVAFLLFEIGGVVLGPIVMPWSDVGAETLPETFGQADNANQERIMYLGSDNQEALSWRLKAIADAKSEICFESLDLRNDESSHDLMAAMYAAAERGVHVRVIVDGITALTTLKTDSVFAEFYSHPNVEVRFYNEPNLLTPWTLNYRLHEKVVKIDDEFLIVGGRNSMNYFLGNYSATKKLDRDIIVYNTAEDSDLMETAQRHFDAYWDYEKCTDASPWASPSSTLTSHWASLIASDPSIIDSRTWTDLTYPVDDVAFITGGIEATNKEPTLWNNICIVAATGNEVIIQTPYVMFSSEMYADLTALSMSRKVSIVTNDITDHTNAFGTMDLTHERDNITATGATLIEVQWESFVHAKAIIVDSDISLIGSFNCDCRSAYLDNECMLVIKSSALNERLRSEVSSGLEAGYAQSTTGNVAGPNYDMEKRNNNSVFWNIAGFITKPIRYLF